LSSALSTFSGASIFAPQAGQFLKSGDSKPDLQLLHSLIMFAPHHTHCFWFSWVEEPHPVQYRYSIAIVPSSLFDVLTLFIAMLLSL
jgi:hypothetical protein